MCSNDMGRKMRDSSVMRALSKLTLFVLCSCHLLAIVWQRQMMCSKWEGRCKMAVL